MHVMIDIETMAVSPDAAICAIGACAFDPAAPGDGLIPDGRGEWYRVVSLDDAIRQGGRVDGSTIIWWLQQHVTAQGELCGRAESMLVALSSLSDWMRGIGMAQVWGNGADFDLVVLGTAYRRAAIAAPWSYRQVRCYRTLRELTRGQVDLPAMRTAEVQHRALDDARYQARAAVAMLRAVDQGLQVAKQAAAAEAVQA